MSYYVSDKVTDTVSLLHLIMTCQLMRHSNSDIQINGKLESSVLASLVPGVRRECSRIFNCNKVPPERPLAATSEAASNRLGLHACPEPSFRS